MSPLHVQDLGFVFKGICSNNNIINHILYISLNWKAYKVGSCKPSNQMLFTLKMSGNLVHVYFLHFHKLAKFSKSNLFWTKSVRMLVVTLKLRIVTM